MTDTAPPASPDVAGPQVDLRPRLGFAALRLADQVRWLEEAIARGDRSAARAHLGAIRQIAADNADADWWDS